MDVWSDGCQTSVVVTIDLQREFAIERDAELARGAIQQALRGYSLEACKRALLRALASVGADLDEQVRAAKTPQTQSQTQRSAPQARKKVTARPKQTRYDKARAALEARPRMPIKELAVEMYGEETVKTLQATRTLLDEMRKRKMIKRVGVGQWEVVAKKD